MLAHTEIWNARILNVLEFRSCVPSCWITRGRRWSITHSFPFPHPSCPFGFKARFGRKSNSKLPSQIVFSKICLGYSFDMMCYLFFLRHRRCQFGIMLFYWVSHRRRCRCIKCAAAIDPMLLLIFVAHFHWIQSIFEWCAGWSMETRLLGHCWIECAALWLSKIKQRNAVRVERRDWLHCVVLYLNCSNSFGFAYCDFTLLHYHLVFWHLIVWRDIVARTGNDKNDDAWCR